MCKGCQCDPAAVLPPVVQQWLCWGQEGACEAMRLAFDPLGVRGGVGWGKTRVKSGVADFVSDCEPLAITGNPARSADSHERGAVYAV